MKSRFATALCVLLASSPLHSAEPSEQNSKTISVDELSKLKILGKLGIPLGKVVEIRATIVAGEGKADSTRYFFKVSAIAGKPLKQPVIIRFRSQPDSKYPATAFDLLKLKKGEASGSLTEDVRKSLEKDYVGSEVKFLGFESGSFTGIPEGLPDRNQWQGADFQFLSEVVVFSED